MNHVYRLVWSRARGMFVLASEISRGTAKAGRAAAFQPLVWLAALPIGLIPLTAIAGGPVLLKAPVMAPVAPAVQPRKMAAAMPTATPSSISLTTSPSGGQVSAGSGNISQSGLTTTIDQHSQNLSLNWQTFNIGADGTVNFVQPNAQAIAVNRIADPNGSVILGTLNANGQVFLINPNGVLFGQGAQVNVGGLVASTLDVSDSALVSGKLQFSGDSQSRVVNQGTINATDGGYIALVGAQVVNDGTLSANGGTVALGGGNAVTLRFDGNQLLGMQVDRSTLDALAENNQLIVADGGQVLMSAGAKDSLLASVVNNTGTIQAQTVENREGKIVLLGGMAAGTTTVAGTLDASAYAGGDGGFIETSAARVSVADGTRITTLAAGGSTGTWLIDPTDFTIAAGSGASMSSSIGADTLSNALDNTDVRIETVAIGAENGDIHVNSAVSWSANELTLSAHGDININASLNGSGTAKLALEYGQGALAAGNTADYHVNAAVNLAAGNNFSTKLGSDGSTLVYTVVTSLGVAGDTGTTSLQGIDNNLSGRYVLGSDIDASATSGWNGGAGFDPIGNPPVSPISANHFTGRFDGLGHTISGLTINRSSRNYIGLFGWTDAGSSIRNIGLLGGSVTGGGFVGSLVGRSDGTVSRAYATGSVSGVSQVGGLAGENGGTITQAFATGQVSASGNSVGGLVGSNKGPISQSYATGAVTNSGTGGSGHYTGGLVGNNYFHATQAKDTIISQSYATGAVTSNNPTVGGLVGNGAAPVNNSYWNTETTGQTTSVGGGTGLTTAELIATMPTGFTTSAWGNGGNQTTSYLLGMAGNQVFNINDLPTGTVTTTNRPNLYTAILDVDQLQAVDTNRAGNYLLGNDIDASATAAWNVGAGFDPIGDDITPFAGSFDGLGHTITGLTINRSATNYVGLFGILGSAGEIRSIGLVGGSVTGTDVVGGLVGLNDGGTISNAYATGAVSGTNYVGGLVGFNDASTISNAYATGAVSGTNHVGGLVGFNDASTISNAYATGAVSGTSYIGGLVGLNSLGAVTNSYWDTQTTGQTTSAGGTAQTTAQLQAALSSGFDGAVWGIVAGKSYAYLLSQFAPGAAPQVVSGTVYNDGGATPAGAGITVSGLVDDNTLASTLTGGDVSTGANGYYYYLLAPDTLNTGASQVLTYVEAVGAQPDGAAFTDDISTSISGLNIHGNALHVQTASTAWSTVQANLLIALSGNVATGAFVSGLQDMHIDAGGAFAFDVASPLSVAGDLIVDADGDIIQTTAVTVAGTSNIDAGSGAIALTNAGNDFAGAVSLTGGATQITDANTLTLGTINADSLVSSAASAITLTGDVTTRGTQNYKNAVLLGSDRVLSGTDITFASTVDGAYDLRMDSTGATTFGDAVGATIALTSLTTNAGGNTVLGGNVITMGAQTYNDAVILASDVALSSIGAGAISLNNTVDGSHNLTVNAAGATTFGGAVGATRALTTLMSTSGTFSAGALNIGGPLAVTTSAGGITQNGAFTVLGTSNLNAGSGAITLTNAGNDFGGAVSLTGGATQIADSNALVLGNVQTTSLAATVAGDLTLNGPIAVSTDIDLTAGGAIAINTDIVNTATRLTLDAGTGITAQVIDVASFTLNGGTWSQLNAALPTFNATSFTLAGGTFLRALGGDGSIANPYQLTDVYGLQGVGSAGMLGLNYTLANNIDASGTSGWNGGAGFVPITGYETVADPFSPMCPPDCTQTLTLPFTGLFDGLGHTISNLTINRPTENYIGLFGSIQSGAVVRNLGLVGGTISGMYQIGGLAGENRGTISNIYVTANVNGRSSVGGLVGRNSGTISGSYATGNINDIAYVDVGVISSIGGLVGFNNAVIDSSYSTGNVNGTNYMGGLVGMNEPGGMVRNSYATGNVVDDYHYRGNYANGGLVGFNTAQISNSYASGSVVDNGANGGLVGYSAGGGTITNSYWNSAANAKGIGTNNNSATTTGLTTAEMMQSASFSSWNIADTGGSSAVWRIYEGHTTPLLRAFMTHLTVTGHDVSAIYNSTAFTGSNDFTLGSVTPGNWHPSTTANPGLVLGSLAPITPAINAGSYALGDGLYSSQMGYDLDITPSILTIDPATLILTTSNVTKTYDGNTAAVGSLGINGTLYGSDSLSGGTFTFDNKNAGTNKTVSVSGVAINDGNGGGNYSVTYIDNTTSTILAKAIASVGGISADSKIYDGNATATLDFGGTTFVGMISGDDLTVASATGSFADKNAAIGKTVTINAIALGGVDAGNYTLTDTTASTTGDISQLGITVDATASDKVYDATTTTTIALSSSGVLAGDSVAFAGTGTFSDKNAGTDKTVTINITATGADAGNYSYNTSAMDTADIAQLGITVGATGNSKVYDGTAFGTVSLSGSGVLAGDVVSFIGNGTFADKNAGAGKAVTVTDIAAAGADASNYSYNATASTTADITQLGITVNATADDKVYDATTDAAIALGSNGVLAGDAVAFTGTGAFDDKHAGIGKTVTVNGISARGTDAGNYTFNTTAGAKADITPATLIYQADPASFWIGQSINGLGGTVTGLLGSDTLADSTEGMLAWTTPATSSSRAGQYAINGGGLSAGNYVFEQAPGNATALRISHGSAPAVVIRTVAGLQQQDDADTVDAVPYAPNVHIVDGGVRLP